MKTFGIMLKNELKLSLRGMDMLIFAVFLPIIVLIIIGIIYSDKPAFDGSEYTFIEQSFGALITISICAGGVMGLPLVVSDYRNRKILKRYRVTPIGPLMILMVQVVIYTIYSLVSLISVYAVASIFFGFHPSGSLLIFFIAYLLVMIAMFSIGMMVGGLSPNAKAAGVYASILYFPMLIFSGATLPYEIMPQTLRNFADILPLTQGIKLLKAAVLGIPADNFFLPVISMSAISCVCIFAAVKFFRWE